MSNFTICRPSGGWSWIIRWLVLLPVLSLSAQSEPGEPELLEIAPLRLELTMDAALLLALENNFEIAAQTAGLAASEAEARAAWGRFEPRLVLRSQLLGNERLNTRQEALSQNPFAESASSFDERNASVDVSIENELPTGGQIGLVGSWNQLENNLYDNLPQDSEIVTSVGVRLRQPLLRGAGFAAALAELRRSASVSERVLHETRLELQRVLSQTEMAYWSLALAREQESLLATSTARAERLLGDVRALTEAGQSDQIEVLQAQTFLARSRAQEQRARQAVTNATAQLKAALGLETEVAPVLVVPVDPLELTEEQLPVPEDSLWRARRFHPAIRAQAAGVDIAEIESRYRANERLPQVDLIGSYGLNGLGEFTRPSLDVLAKGNYESWFIGLEVTVPLFGGVREEQNLIAARRRVRQARMSESAVEQQLTHRLLAIFPRLAALEMQATRYAEVVDLSEQLLEAEFARLDRGRGDSRDVQDAEQELTEGRLALLDSQFAVLQARVEQASLEGTYLLRRGLDLLSGEESVTFDIPVKPLR